MKTLLALIFCLFFTAINANIIDAQNYFEQKKYTASFNEYQGLAKLGNIRAQYNVAIMSYKGLGTDLNTIKAYAWASIAMDKDPEIGPFLKKIEKELSPRDLNNAQLLAEKLKRMYGYDETKVSLGAIPVEGDNKQDNKFFYKGFDIVLHKKSKKKIDYPQKALKKTGRGWVELAYSIYPDGSVRDISILEQYPHELFAPSAIDFISKQKFNTFQHGIKKDLDNEFYTSFRVKYGLYGISLLNSKVKNKINTILKSALQGSLEAQYSYTNLFYSVLNEGGGVSENVINSWLLRSAQFGLANAQFRLGKNIYYGKSCKREKQKGLDWILRAAKNNIGNAQYLAYYLLKTENLKNFTEKTAIDWLLQAAKNKSNNGQIKYAKYIAAKENVSQSELDLAANFLEQYALSVAKTADWYQTQALLLARSHQFSEAKKVMKKAIKIAKKSHWDISGLSKQLADIKAHKINIAEKNEI